MQVSQIYISDSKDELPPYLHLCVERVKACYPDMEHVLYGDDTMREFLSGHFDAEVLAAYNKLNPFAYRADLARYCLLYELGGWYFDVSIMPLTGLNVESDVDTLAFRDIQMNSRTSWACNSGIIFARSRHPVIETAIKKVLRNCRDEYYGISPLCPTGPSLFGQAFAEHGANPRSIFGDLQVLTPLHPNKNIAFVLPNGALLALRKPSAGGDLASLGAKGTNNYNEFYASRTVYR